MKKIYVTLDSIYDTRYTILNSLNLIEDIDTYLNRVNDNFKYLGKKSFYKLYKDRDRDYLFASKNNKTKIIYLIGVLATELKNKNRDNMIELVINTYPYKLLDSEIESFKNIFRNTFTTIDKITMLDNIKTDIDIVDNFDIIIDYEGLDNLNKWILEGLQADYRETRLIAPFSLLDNTLLLKEKVDIEEAVENLNKSMYPFIYLDLIPPGMFSIDIRKK